jgi:hypothetical protein
MDTTKKLITLLLAMLAVNTSIAYDFKVNGIYYLVNGSEATVTAPTPYYIHSNDYTGDVVIPETVTYQGVTYPVTAIGEYAFYWCAELTSIHIPKSIKRVEGSMCFYSCPSLSVVEIESLESWCNIDFEVSNGYDFSYSNPLSYAHDLYISGEKLTELVIPSSVTRIGSSAFCHLSPLSRVEIPSSVTSIGNAAFARCGSIDRLEIPDFESWMQIDIDGLGSNPMGSARKVFFDGIEMSQELMIPETTTNISANAFNGCKIFTSVTFPPSVVEVGTGAFGGCSSLEEVHIQDLAAWCSIKFHNKSANPLYSEQWYIQENRRLYLGDVDVTHSILYLPDSVTMIGDYAFVSNNLRGLVIPDQVISIGKGAFMFSRLEEVIMPEGLLSMGDSIFFCCYVLEHVNLGKSLQKIPDYAFYSSMNLTQVDMPETVTEIGDYAFAGNRLSEMPMNDAITRIGRAAFSSNDISELKAGKSLRAIDEGAFAYCYNLRRVTFDSNVETIEGEAFKEDNNIDSIACKAVMPPVLSADAFENNCYNNATLYVPMGSVEAYKTADVWKNFKNIVVMGMDTIPGDVNGDGEVNIADANGVIDVVVMGGNAGHTRIPAADVNKDGEVNIADVNAIIKIILQAR